MLEYFSISFIFGSIANLIKVIAFLIVIWGVILAMIEFIRLEYHDLNGKNVAKKRDDIRHHLGSYLLFGFEVLIAADLIVTLLEPTFYELSSLVVIVLLRTVLNFFLNKELAESLRAKQKPPRSF